MNFQLEQLILLLCLSVEVYYTKKIKLRKPGWGRLPDEFYQDETTTEMPDECNTGEYLKHNMTELSERIYEILAKPRRRFADSLIEDLSVYVIFLHCYLRLIDRLDEDAIKYGTELVEKGYPKHMTLPFGGEEMKKRIGWDVYEYQHYEWVWEDTIYSWANLTERIADVKNMTV